MKFSKFLLYFTGTTLVLAALASFGCSKSKKSSFQYACVTPLGDITISERTDKNISLENGILRASRDNPMTLKTDHIMIPFSQCVGLKQ